MFDKIRELLNVAVSDDYVDYIANAILDDVEEDIRVSASEKYSDDDLRMAIGRVLVNKLNIEY